MTSQNFSNRTTFRGNNLPYLRNISKAGLLAGFAALAAIVGAMACAEQPPADPMQVAEAHAVAESAAVSADILGWVAQQHPFTREDSREVIDMDIIHEVEWEYYPPISAGEHLADIRAIAYVDFDVNNPLGGTARVFASLPYTIIVDTRAAKVTSMDAIYAEAGLGTGIAQGPGDDAAAVRDAVDALDKWRSE